MATKQPVILPPNRAWTEPNTGYIFGSIYLSRNIRLDVPGILTLAPRMQYVYREAVAGSNFDSVLAIVYGTFGGTASGFSSTNQYIVVTSDKGFLLSSDLTNCGQLTNGSFPTLSAYSDGVSWNDGLYVTTTSNLSKLVAGTVTNSLMSLTSSVPHPLCVSTINNYLLVGNGNKLEKRTTGGSNSTALTLPDKYQIVWVRSSNAGVLIGTRALDGTAGAVFDWDESSAAANNKYDLDAPWPYSGAFRNTDFFIVLNDGRLQKYNGAGFSTVCQFPIYKTLQGQWVLASGTPTSGPVFQRGMYIIGGRLTINVNGKIQNGYEDSPFYENFPAGIWEYDEETGLNQKYGFSLSQSEEDFSQMFYQGAGAIAVVNQAALADPTDGSILLAGARVFDGTSDYYCLSSVVSGGVNRGFFTTTRIETTEIADQQMKLWCKYRGVFEDTDEIIFKYKDQIINHFPFTTQNDVTWSNNTTFTTTEAIFQYVEEGYEVTVGTGIGAGASAHVSSISENAGTYTVILDEAIPSVSASDTGQVIVDNFAKLEITITNADEQWYKGIPIPQATPRTWIQIKGELRGTDLVTIEELQLIAASHILPIS